MHDIGGIHLETRVHVPSGPCLLESGCGKRRLSPCTLPSKQSERASVCGNRTGGLLPGVALTPVQGETLKVRGACRVRSGRCCRRLPDPARVSGRRRDRGFSWPAFGSFVPGGRCPTAGRLVCPRGPGIQKGWGVRGGCVRDGGTGRCDPEEPACLLSLPTPLSRPRPLLPGGGLVGILSRDPGGDRAERPMASVALPAPATAKIRMRVNIRGRVYFGETSSSLVSKIRISAGRMRSEAPCQNSASGVGSSPPCCL